MYNQNYIVQETTIIFNVNVTDSRTYIIHNEYGDAQWRSTSLASRYSIVTYLIFFLFFFCHMDPNNNNSRIWSILIPRQGWKPFSQWKILESKISERRETSLSVSIGATVKRVSEFSESRQVSRFIPGSPPAEFWYISTSFFHAFVCLLRSISTGWNNIFVL